MKSKIIFGIKTYLFLMIYVLLCCFIYAFFLHNNKITESIIIELLIGSSTFLLLGTLYSNHIHKKGLLIGCITGIIHYLLIKLIVSNMSFSVSFGRPFMMWATTSIFLFFKFVFIWRGIAPPQLY